MGLLDGLFDSEGGRLGLGLLAAAGGRADGAGFGQRLQEAVGSVDQFKKAKAQAEFQQFQMEQAKAQAMAQAQARQQAGVDDAAVRGAFAPMDGGSAMSNGQGPTMANAQNIGQVAQFDPRQFLARNPQASLRALRTAMETNKAINPDEKYGFHVVDGNLVRTSERKGTAASVYSAGPKPIDPNKPFFLGADGKVMPNEAYQAFDLRSKKAGATNLSVNTDNLGLKPKDRFDMEDKMRNDYSTATKNDSEIIGTAQDLKSILKQGGALKDQAAIYKFAKSLDPQGAVREADYAAIVKTAGGLDYVTSLVNKALTGEQLSPNQRTEMSSLMDSMASVAQQRIGKVQQRYGANAKMYNLKPENIFQQQSDIGDGWGIVKP